MKNVYRNTASDVNRRYNHDGILRYPIRHQTVKTSSGYRIYAAASYLPDWHVIRFVVRPTGQFTRVHSTYVVSDGRSRRVRRVNNDVARITTPFTNRTRTLATLSYFPVQNTALKTSRLQT